MASYTRGVLCANGSPPVTRTCKDCNATFTTTCRTANHCPTHNTLEAKALRQREIRARSKAKMALNKPTQNPPPLTP
jgi:hypothetical protein